MTDGAKATWRAGHAVLSERVARLPSLAAAHARARLPPLALPSAIRAFVTTGVGCSEAHARFLAHLLAAEFGLPARFVPLSALAGEPPPGSDRDVLLIFSQGLSPNARLPLARAGAWRKVILATAVTEAGALQEGNEARRRTLDRLAAVGGTVVRFPEENEYTTLLRVIGPLAGYITALRLARAIAGRAHTPDEAAREADMIEAALASAAARADAVCAHVPIEALGTPGALAFVTTGEYAELVVNLRYKVLEGLLAPLPPVWDVLHFAHGPFQAGYEHPALFVALTRPESDGDGDLLQRLRGILVPARHAFVELRATLPGPLAILDHEALLNRLVLRAIEARGIDQIGWPGKSLDGPLYDLGTDAVDAAPVAAAPAVLPPRRLDRLTWPELETLVARGVRTAVLPMGATAQHGHRLPVATATLIADALAERFCARVPESVRLPTIAIGCSSEHAGLPGTFILAPETLCAALGDVLASCRAHGFERIFLFSAHRGHQELLTVARVALDAACAPLRLTVCADIDRRAAVFRETGTGHQGGPEDADHRGGEFETSILLALHPDLVRCHATDDTVGDPHPATAGRGERYLTAWVDVLVTAYRQGA